jgi:hypothetical protein
LALAAAGEIFPEDMRNCFTKVCPITPWKYSKTNISCEVEFKDDQKE